MTRAHLALRQLNELEHIITFKWILGLVGVDRKTQMDSLH